MLCFFYSIASCRTALTLGSINDREGKIYCPTCYSRQFGPRGRKKYIFLIKKEIIKYTF